MATFAPSGINIHSQDSGIWQQLLQLRRYTESTLMAALVQSFFTAWIITKTSQTEIPINEVGAGDIAGVHAANPIENNLSESDARSRIARVDKNRASYYRYFTDENWGQARNYDLCINSGNLDALGAVSVIKTFVEARQS